MSKYRNLTAHLYSLNTLEWRATFAEIEQVLGFELPASAYEHPAWWANQAGGHAQSSSWQEAGWRTESLDLEGKSVTFAKPLSNALSEFGQSTMRKAPFLNALAPGRQSERGGFLSSVTDSVRPLTIGQAKAGLAAQFGIPESSIEIIIKG